MEEAGLKYISLTNYEALIQLAVERKLVTEAQQSILLEWSSSPATWTGKK
jgi:orotate phosphoribosyltransferase